MRLHTIEISENKNGTSYQAWCGSMNLNLTIHHHDLDEFIKRHESCPTTRIQMI